MVKMLFFFFFLGRNATLSSLYIVQLHSLMDSQSCIHSVLLTTRAKGSLIRDLFIFPMYYSLDYMSFFI